MVGRKTYTLLYTFLILLIMGFILNSCSTKKNTWTRRAFHNLTSHYNVYWNGLMSLQEGEILQKEKARDDFNKVLRVYNFGTKADARSLFPKMDRTIEKASIAIQRHSMVFSGRERVKWIPRSYLIMGIGHFYKHDYISARRVFDYISNEYKKNPIRYEALLWLAETYIQMERPAKADATLNLLSSKKDDEDFPEKVYERLPLVQADLFISQGDYYGAYPYLERALEISKDRYMVNRVLFILGQINQKDGDFNRATRYYAKLIKRNPPYELAFKARLNLAKCYDSQSGNSKAITKLLLKMTKEAKNETHLDEIYYALADVALEDNNDTLAIWYLRKSVATSVTNNYQKATSSLEVANLYFEKADYKYAQLYYDTAVSSMPGNFPNYKKIKERAGVLTDILTQHQVIQVQDSLQKLAKMSPEDRNAIIDAAIERYKKAEELRMQQEEEEREAREAEQMAMQNGNKAGMGSRRGPGGPPSLGGGNGKWYFYNPQALSKGYTEFVRKWGKRQLTDNWRISDKRQMMINPNEMEVDMETDSTNADSLSASRDMSTPYNRDYYLKDLPKTEEDFKNSDSLIVEAYHKLGELYKESLRDTAAALKVYSEFMERFPNNKYELESWFALYQLYNGQGDVSNGAKYKSLVLAKYPESDYARVIVDPNYFVKKAEKKGQVNKLYDRAYKAYDREQYFRVLSYANRAIDEYPDNKTLMPRFLFLRAMALGKVTTVDSMYTEMKSLVAAYPASEVTPMAKDVINMLSSEYGFDGGSKAEKEKKKKETKYKINEKIPHFVILTVNSNKIKVNPLKVRISDFNRKYFRLRKLKIKSLLLDNQRTIITVGNFNNQQDAVNYYLALKDDEYVLSGVDKKDYNLFPISTQNYPIMYRDKDVKGYLEFVKEYLKLK